MNMLEKSRSKQLRNYWNPERKLGAATHFSEIIINKQHLVHVILKSFKLKCMGTPNFFFLDFNDTCQDLDLFLHSHAHK